jgi:hypothetical protein
MTAKKKAEPEIEKQCCFGRCKNRFKGKGLYCESCKTKIEVKRSKRLAKQEGRLERAIAQLRRDSPKSTLITHYERRLSDVKWEQTQKRFDDW